MEYILWVSHKKKQVSNCLHQYWTTKFLNPQCINPPVSQRSCGTVPFRAWPRALTPPVQCLEQHQLRRKPGTPGTKPGTWGSRPSDTPRSRCSSKTKMAKHEIDSSWGSINSINSINHFVGCTPKCGEANISLVGAFNPQISGQDQLGCYHTDVDAVNEAITWCIHNEQKYALKTWNCQPRRCDKLTTLVIFTHSVRILSLPPYSDRHCGENICCSLKTADTFPIRGDWELGLFQRKPSAFNVSDLHPWYPASNALWRPCKHRVRLGFGSLELRGPLSFILFPR